MTNSSLPPRSNEKKKIKIFLNAPTGYYLILWLREKRKRTFWEPHKGKGEKKTRSMFSSPHFFSLPEKKSFSCTIFLCVYIYTCNIFIRYYYYYSPKTQELCEKCKKNIRKISFNKASVFFFFLCSFWRREFFLNWRCANKLKPMMLDSRKPVFPLLKTTLLCDSSIHVLVPYSTKTSHMFFFFLVQQQVQHTHTHTQGDLLCVCVSVSYFRMGV
jgi:hypothetical protein